MATKKTAKVNAPKTSTSTTTAKKKNVYVPVSHHIYFQGHLYRVRVSKDGKRNDEYFSSKKKAFAYRKNLLGK